jgi:transposase
VRHWVCEACGSPNDRDVNAAVNTLLLGMERASNYEGSRHVT